VLANTVLHAVPLAVDGRPCNFPTVVCRPVALEMLFVATAFNVFFAAHPKKLSFRGEI
jgi:hypothetical protein